MLRVLALLTGSPIRLRIEQGTVESTVRRGKIGSDRPIARFR
jgi:hypothetical protein